MRYITAYNYLFKAYEAQIYSRTTEDEQIRRNNIRKEYGLLKNLIEGLLENAKELEEVIKYENIEGCIPILHRESL